MGIVSAKGRNNLGLLDSVSGYENFIQTDAGSTWVTPAVRWSTPKVGSWA